jgi:hypothetical protein
MESTKPFKIRNDLNLKSDGVGGRACYAASGIET